MKPVQARIEVDGADIAVSTRAGDAPGLVWLGGYRSDMTGTKAEHLDALAQEKGIAFVRHDYSGHGASGGDFAEGTISRWLKESLAVFERFCEGPQILVGSSMGAWIALRMVQELAGRKAGASVAGLVLIAPAPDFVMELLEPSLSETEKKRLERDGKLERKSRYSDAPNLYTRALIEDGPANRVLDGIIETHCPVHILQGMADREVPHDHALKLVEHLPADDVTLSLVRDGDHRLSRPQDLALLTHAVEAMLERIAVA